MKNEEDDSLPLAKRRREHQGQPTTTTTCSTTNNSSVMERYALQEIPLGVAHYEVSWMHRSIVTRMAYSDAYGYILTCSNDGVCKFWKRLVAAPNCLEFVKSYQAHKSSILSLSVDASHSTAATVGIDNTIQIYDISSFDISSTIFCTQVQLGEHAAFCCSKETLLLATSSRELNKGDIYIWHVLLGTLFQTLTFHASPITSIQYNIRYNCALSTDIQGIIEIWDCTLVTDDTNNNDTLRIGSTPSLQANGIQWTSKISTSLYEFAKHKVIPISSTFSSNGKYMAIYGNDDKIRLFSFPTGRILYIYDESASMYATTLSTSIIQENVYDMDVLEYGKRAATEREMAETTIYTGGVSTPSTSSSASYQLITMAFDSSSTLLLYPTLMGIKVVSILNHTCCRIIGKGDASSLRFVTFCLCSGDAKVNAQMELMRTGGSSTAMNPLKDNEEEEMDTNKDPMLICAAFQKKRIYVFSNRDPLDSVTTADEEEDTTAIISQVQINRNIINEPPDADDLWSANAAVAIMMANSSLAQKNKVLGTEAVLRTTMGDIHIRLFGEQVRNKR